MSICGSSGLDTIALQSWAFFWKIWKAKNAPFSQALKTCFWHTFFQTALIQRPIEIFPLNQLQMATNTLNFQWKKAEPIYLSPLQRYLYLKSGLILSGNFDGFKEVQVQVNKAVLGYVLAQELPNVSFMSPKCSQGTLIASTNAGYLTYNYCS